MRWGPRRARCAPSFEVDRVPDDLDSGATAQIVGAASGDEIHWTRLEYEPSIHARVAELKPLLRRR